MQLIRENLSKQGTYKYLNNPQKGILRLSKLGSENSLQFENPPLFLLPPPPRDDNDVAVIKF